MTAKPAAAPQLFAAEGRYPDAAKELRAWYKTVANARWRSLVDVPKVFPDPDGVAGYVIEPA